MTEADGEPTDVCAGLEHDRGEGGGGGEGLPYLGVRARVMQLWIEPDDEATDVRAGLEQDEDQQHEV